MPEPVGRPSYCGRGQRHWNGWTSPRATFPEGRAGYLRWREELKFHARRVGDIMGEAGYGTEDVARVTALITKRPTGPATPETSVGRRPVFGFGNPVPRTWPPSTLKKWTTSSKNPQNVTDRPTAR
ncbi:MAG: DUF4202 family protein [Elusimicrobia bacterium]|nr:DUF4202 family protein [Elusimicrobiota bacterium]